MRRPQPPPRATEVHCCPDWSHSKGRPLGRAREVRGPNELEGAFVAMTQEQADGLIVLVDPVLIDHRARIADLAGKSRLPAVYGVRDHVEAGGLMCYSANLSDMFRRAAYYVDRIL